MKPPKNLYIINGVTNQIKGEWPIHFYDLVSKQSIPVNTHVAIHFKTPDDFLVRKITHIDIDGTVLSHSYEACDNRSLDSLDWMPIVRINGKWVIRYDLKYCKSFDDYNIALKLEGYTPVPVLGYLNPKQYRKWTNRVLKNAQ